MRFRLYLETDLNRVFSGSVPTVAAAELAFVAGVETEIHQSGRTAYLSFEAEELPAGLGSLCASAALFEEVEPDLLRPVEMTEPLTFPTDIVSIQRYRGKTNERFTRLMLNLAKAAAPIERPVLLDPMCGRGTTLNWALVYGLRSVGFDDNRKGLDEYTTFLEQWAKNHRYPHRIVKYNKNNNENRAMSFTVGRSRAELDAKTGADIETFHLPAGVLPTELPKQPKFKTLVTDLPYGAQHSMVGDRGKRRSGVAELVEANVEQWKALCAKDASLVVAWNVKETKRRDLKSALHRGGFEPLGTAEFTHVVDRTITRDIIVATARKQAAAPLPVE